MPPQSAELKVTYPPNCPVAKELCGFERRHDGHHLRHRPATSTPSRITQVQDAAGHLQHRGQDLNYAYDGGRDDHADRQQHLLPRTPQPTS